MSAQTIAESPSHHSVRAAHVSCPLFRPSTGHCGLVPFLEAVRVPSREIFTQFCATANFRECSAFRTATGVLATIGGIDWWCRDSVKQRDHALGE